jgi:amino acid adenylation domain-containing protein
MGNTMVSNSIQERFAAQVARTPDAVAVSSGATRLTYRELDERANRLAHRLIDLGVRPEDPVAMLLERSIHLPVAVLATLKAGGVYLPLHNAAPLQRMQWIMDHAGYPVLLADEATSQRSLPAGGPVVLVDSDERQLTQPATAPRVPAALDGLALVMYTSGSEGQPSGVGVTHRGVLQVALDSCWDGDRQQRVLMLAPHAFAVSTYELWVPLLRGGHLVLAPPAEFDVGSLRRLISDEKITALHLTAGLFRVVAEEAPDCLRGVREVLTGGDVISAGAVQRVLGECPGIVVRALYGSTEVSLFATSSPMTAGYRAGRTVPVGRAQDNVRLHVLDERLSPVPPGTVGELYISAERLARGYFRRPGRTAERYLPDPFGGPGQRMYRTGDLVKLTPDGLIDFVGRAGDQVKIRGFRVAVAEVETALASYPGVTHAVVVATGAEDGDKRLIGYVVAAGGDIDVAALRAHVRQVLPDYMVPAAIVVIDALPLTPNGKLDRRALPEPVIEATASYRPPETATQEALCAMFAEVLGVQRVGLDDSFFDLSGQSLIAMRLIKRINEALGAELSITDLFDAPTVAELDRQLGASQPSMKLVAAVTRTLADGGVMDAFGVVGNGNLLAVSSLIADGIRYVQARHEGGAMAMADSYYRVTGEVAICTTTYGPGLANTATALAEAAKYRSGVLVLCGDGPAGRSRAIDIEQAEFARALGARTIRIEDPATARAQTAEALRLARSGPSPVLLSLPSDLLQAEVPAAPSPVSAPPREHRIPSGAAELEAALDALARARRPLLLAGLGAWRAGAAKPIMELGDRLGALLATTVMADGLFNGSPWQLGIIGGFATPPAARIISEADTVVVFGSSLNDFTLNGGKVLHPDAVLIQVDVARAPTIDRVDLCITGDASTVACALLDGVNARDLPVSAWRTEVAGEVKQVGWAHQPYDDASTDDRIDPRTLSLALARLLPEARTVVTDGGHFVAWPAMYWPVPDPSAYVFTGVAFQSIGLGFAGAVGAAAGRADRTVVIALGDGGALMGLPELETLIRVAKSALVVIYDDAAYGSEVHMYGPLGIDIGPALFHDTDFAGVARAFGASAVTVRRAGDLAAVTRWREQGSRGTLVLDCKVVPHVVARYLAELADRIRAGAM